MNSGTLSVWMHGQLAGRLTRAEGRLSFSYDDTYRFDQDATPLSVAMPLATRRHDHSVVEPWLDGLVPDREATLTRWARQHDVAGHAFALLSTSIGMDCAGAVQFSREEEPSTAGSVTPVDDSEATGTPPTVKYQSFGGPGTEATLNLLRERAETDITRFLDLQGVAWLIGATDIHAKNVSLQLARDAVRLAPAYDVASTLPYERRQGLKLAMHVGGEYRIDWIRRRHWERVADQAGVAPDSLLQRLAVLAAAVPAAWDRAVDALALAAEDRMVANDFKAAIMPNVEACAAALTDPD